MESDDPNIVEFKKQLDWIRRGISFRPKLEDLFSSIVERLKKNNTQVLEQEYEAYRE